MTEKTNIILIELRKSERRAGLAIKFFPDVEEEGNRDKAAWVQQSGQLITNAAGA